VFFSLISLVIVNLIGQDLSYENNKELLIAQTQESATKLTQRINDIDNLVNRLTLLVGSIESSQLNRLLPSVLQRTRKDINIISAHVLPIEQGPILTLKKGRFTDTMNDDITTQYWQQSWFKDTRNLSINDVNWSQPVSSLNSKNNAFSALVSSPYFVNGNVAGVIVMRIAFFNIDMLLNQSDRSLTGYSLLVDKNEQPISFSAHLPRSEFQPQPQPQQGLAVINNWQEFIVKQNTIIQENVMTSLFLEPAIAIATSIPKTQWAVVSIVPQGVLMDGFSSSQTALLFSLGTLIIFMSGIGLYVIKSQLLSPLAELEEAFSGKPLMLNKDAIASPYREVNNLVTMVNTSLAQIHKEHATAASDSIPGKRRLIEGINSEIKTPINTILSSVSLLKKSNLSAQDKEYISLVERSAKMSIAILDNVANYSKIISGDLVIEHRRFDLFALLDQVYTSLRTKLSGNLRVRFSLNYPEDSHRFFYGDPERLQQVLIDLVSNALKFTSRGFVELKIESMGRTDASEDACEVLVFAITDTGIGMPQSKIDMLLQPPSIELYDPINLNKPGLTLSICHRLILLMGGKLTAESLLGEGSTFKVELALHHAEQLGNQHLISCNAIAINKLANLNALLIDDNKINQVLAQKIFHLLQIKAYIGADIADAEQLMQANKIDIIYLRTAELVKHTKLLRSLSNKQIPIVGLLEIQDHLDCSNIELSGLLNMPLTRQALVEETVRIFGFESTLADVLHPLNQKVE